MSGRRPLVAHTQCIRQLTKECIGFGFVAFWFPRQTAENSSAFLPWAIVTQTRRDRDKSCETTDNSPAIYRWDNGKQIHLSLGGLKEINRQLRVFFRP